MENLEININGGKAGFPNIIIKTTSKELCEYMLNFTNLMYDDKVLINYTVKCELKPLIKNQELIWLDNYQRLISNIVTYYVTEYLISGKKIPISNTKKSISSKKGMLVRQSTV